MAWKNKEIVSKKIPDWVPDVVDGAATVMDKYNEVLKLIKEQLSTISVATAPAPSLLSILLTDVFNTLTGLLDTITQPAAIHVLALSPNKFDNLTWADVITNTFSNVYDDARPLYTDKDIIVGSLIFGYADQANPNIGLSDLLQLFHFYYRIVGETTAMFDGYTIPVPRNFKAKLITRPGDFSEVIGFRDTTVVKTPLAVKLSWDPRPQTSLIKLGKVDINRIKIYKSNEPFPPEPTPDDLSPYVIFDSPFKFAINEIATFIDADIEPDTVYYYKMAYDISIEDKPYEDSLTTHTERVDTSKEIRRSKAAGFPRWVAVKNPLTMFPAVQDAVTLAQGMVNKHLFLTTDTENPIESQVNTLAKIIEKNDQLVDRLRSAESRITSILNFETSASVSAYPFIEYGGVDGLATTILNAMQDSSAPELNANTIAGGLLILTGGRTSTEIQSAKLIIETISGATDLFNSVKDKVKSL